MSASASATVAGVESVAPAVASGMPAVVVSVAPVVLATAAEGARLVAGDGQAAYWVDAGSHAIMSVPLAGGEARQVAVANAPTAMLVHGDDLYFADSFPDKDEAKIFKVSKAGGKPVVVWRSRAGTSEPGVLDLAVWKGGLYFTDALTVSKVESGGTDSVVNSMAPRPNFALDAEGLVVAQRASLRPDLKKGPGMLLRILEDGKPAALPSFEMPATSAEGSASAGPLPIDVAADAGGVYWMDAAGSPDVPVRLMALRKNTVKPAVVARVSFFPDGLVAHAGSLYWRANESIMSVPASGGDETLVVRSNSAPMKLDSFTIAGDKLIWIDGPRVLARALPRGTNP